MSTSAQLSSYRHIAKSTAIFGGTQLVTMAVNILKGKLSAVLLGGYGMGISSHLSSTLTPIQGFFTFGLTTSAVQTLSSISEEEQRSSYVKCFRRLILLLASMAMLSTLSCAWWLSRVTFQSASHWHWFVYLSVAIFFLMLASGEATILQGYRKLRSLAINNIVPPLTGLLIAVPLYWMLGVEGIAPSIALLGLTSWGASRYLTHRLAIHPVQQSWRDTFRQGKGMLTLGATIMTTTVIGSLSTYLTNTFIGYSGTEADIGFYQAANTITLQCTAMVFTAMGTDYFPHLSSIAHNHSQARKLVNQEGEIVMLTIIPLVTLLITLSPLLIRILLTSEFDAIIFLLRCMSLCLIGRATCFPLDYLCIAKKDHIFFFCMEGLWTNVKTTALLMVGYHLGGLDGIGIALLLGAVIDISLSIALNLWRYGISYSSRYYLLGSLLSLAAIGCFAASFIPSSLVSYTLMALITAITLAVCLFQIDKRIHLRQLIKQKLHARS